MKRHNQLSLSTSMRSEDQILSCRRGSWPVAPQGKGWLQLGALMMKGWEYAEAERAFRVRGSPERAGVHRHPGG